MQQPRSVAFSETSAISVSNKMVKNVKDEKHAFVVRMICFLLKDLIVFSVVTEAAISSTSGAHVDGIAAGNHLSTEQRRLDHIYFTRQILAKKN